MTPPAASSEIVRPGDSAAARCGGKVRALGALQATGLPIPPWFALAPAAFYAAARGQDRGAFEDGALPGWIAEAIAECPPTPGTRRALAQALAELCPAGEPVAVRSSAPDEDGVRHSFAGQLQSFLFVRPAEVPGRVADVWRSAFSARVLAYRRERGLHRPPAAPAVLIQRMVDAECSGVAFGADPVSGRRGEVVVAAVYGLGTLLVSGEQNADTYRVDRGGRILDREIAHKRFAHRPAPGAQGLSVVEVPEADARRPVLGDGQIRAVADLVRRAGAHFGCPQDIEWAIERGRLYLLQSRPITSLAGIADPDGVRAIWDNSNIAESYGGMTTPLTFSFARGAYETVYRQFCRIMHVPAGTIEAHEETLHRMLGLIRGRIYYNLLSWYRLRDPLRAVLGGRRCSIEGVGDPPGRCLRVHRVGRG
jgi:rifampicin phosphotransferase